MSVAVSESPVLVTGVTGFLGRAVTRRLLGSGRPVLALARARDGRDARTRVAAAVGREPDGRSLDVVEAGLDGDGAPRHPAASRRLAAVETVIHCAGDTSFFPADVAVFRAGHLAGPLALLRALAGMRLRRWAHVSTAYVAGQRSGTVREDEGDVGQTFHNVYERVKLEAETAMRAAGRTLGIDVRVLRPSIVVGAAPATTGGAPAHLFFDFVRLLAGLASARGSRDGDLRIAARPRAPFNIVPVDYVAAAIHVLAEAPGAAGGAFHLVAAAPPTQEQVLAMLLDRLGARGVRVVEAVDLAAPSALECRVARWLAPYREYLEQDIHFDASAARALLDRAGVPAPVLDARALGALVDVALARPASPVEVSCPAS
jgi:long-chain acyl-CoA synthetase